MKYTVYKYSVQFITSTSGNINQNKLPDKFSFSSFTTRCKALFNLKCCPIWRSELFVFLNFAAKRPYVRPYATFYFTTDLKSTLALSIYQISNTLIIFVEIVMLRIQMSIILQNLLNDYTYDIMKQLFIVL